jgi:hypothetical protein
MVHNFPWDFMAALTQTAINPDSRSDICRAAILPRLRMIKLNRPRLHIQSPFTNKKARKHSQTAMLTDSKTSQSFPGLYSGVFNSISSRHFGHLTKTPNTFAPCTHSASFR